jgi:hypothetical protein
MRHTNRFAHFVVWLVPTVLLTSASACATAESSGKQSANSALQTSQPPVPGQGAPLQQGTSDTSDRDKNAGWFGLHTSDVITLAGAVVAVAALGVSVMTGMQNRLHNRLSVRPNLRVDRLTYQTKPVQIALTNNGTGPAIIRDTIIKVDGKLVGNGGDAPVIVKAAKQLSIPGHFNSFTLSPGDSIRAAESVTLLELLDFSADLKERQQVRTKLFQITLEIRYESIYGETFSEPPLPRGRARA